MTDQEKADAITRKLLGETIVERVSASTGVKYIRVTRADRCITTFNDTASGAAKALAWAELVPGVIRMYENTL